MIRFYAPKDPYGFFSNFSRHKVVVFGYTWSTSEHAFQAMKYSPHRPDLVAKVRHAPTPGQAARLGRDRSFPLHPLWEAPIASRLAESKGELVCIQDKIPLVDDNINRMGVIAEPAVHRYKDLVMYKVVFAKFSREDLKAELLATGDEVLIEDALHDPYWGWGASHVGENKLGRILMTVRESLRTGQGVLIGSQALPD
jgi:predicted NAD-dependent protein-ADP-ribosyltransferase YbiA (DUF1768 family)